MVTRLRTRLTTMSGTSRASLDAMHQYTEFDILEARVTGLEKALYILIDAVDEIQQAAKCGELMYATKESQEKLREQGYIDS